MWDLSQIKYPVVEFVTSTSVEAVIPEFRYAFHTYEIPEEVKSNNGLTQLMVKSLPSICPATRIHGKWLSQKIYVNIKEEHNNRKLEGKVFKQEERAHADNYDDVWQRDKKKIAWKDYPGKRMT